MEKIITEASGKPKFYLTTPIYYANSRPHVGSAYTTIACDVIARYKRMCGYDVAYLTGMDEHGVNIERAAEKQGITPRQLVDKNCKIFQDLWQLLGISNTHFVRTTSQEHAQGVQELILRTKKLDEKRDPAKKAIYKRQYEGRYCIYDNLYVSDTPDPIDCPTCGRPAELISEENYFFRLSAFEKRLLDLYAKNPEFLVPEFRFNEVISFVKSGLKDISISRKSIKWGIPWPDDPEHVFYVWYDALTSYMTGIGFHSADPKKRAEFDRFWPADIHAMGKEIIRFHAVYWPAFLMAADMPLPKQIVAHGWLLFEQEKMSKSKGNVAYPEPIVKAFDNLTGAKVGNDALRYYLLRETVFGQDGNFSREALITRYNSDLANGLGNLASRTLTMIGSYFHGRVPAPESDREGKEEAALRQNVVANAESARIHFDKYDFSGALQNIWQIISLVDFYLVSQKPWKTDRSAEIPASPVNVVLYHAAEAVRMVAVLAHPVLPDATQKIWEQLGQAGRLEDQRVDRLEWGGLKPGTEIGKPEAVFPRVDKKETWERIEVMENEIKNPDVAKAPSTAAQTPGSATTTAAAAATGVPASASAAPQTITIDDFAKLDLRVGVVESAERIAGADKLLKLRVDLGSETRQVLAGIALAYAPEELVGRKVVVVANLAPRKMRGLESAGMILAASGPDDKPILCTFAEEIAPGSRVK
jgi:methionyl-tRNA synthetase